jgi:alpha-galactosidase
MSQIPPHADVVDLRGISLPLMSRGPARRLSDRELLLPPGDVALLHPWGKEAEFFRHGWNSWSPSGWRNLSEAPLRIEGSPERLLTADDARNDTPLAHSGSAVGALRGRDGATLLLGALGLGAPRVGATDSTLWGAVEDPSAEWLLAAGDESEVFARYGQLLAERIGRRERRAGRVWCSWYSYYEDISESLVRATVDDLRGEPFDVVQLDDGWERSVGDWHANERFAAGMDATAQYIADAGFRAGLWLAPLIALPASEFARKRPDLLVSGTDGAPLIAGYNWGGPYYALDTTRPEVQDHLRELFSRVRGWGFTYLKLDFMYAGALAGVRSADLHREQAYRDAIALIRETVGDDTYLLGCGVPMLPSAGIFDGVRVGPDVGAFWDNAERSADPSGVGARNAMLASINRHWLRPLYETDPDVVYFRRRRSLLDEQQRQALQDVATILGFKSTSDPAAWLDEGERRELRSWLEADEHVEQVARYVFRVDGRVVDLTPFATGYVAPPATNAN